MKGRRFGIAAFVVTGVLAGAVVVGHGAGYRLNFTNSAPYGLWRVAPVQTAAIERGQLIEVCPPTQPIVSIMRERGYLSAGRCENKTTTLLKPVSAVAGDLVQLQADGLASVNGVKLVNTEAMENLPSWPAGQYRVQSGEVWLFSAYSAGSFDSRYFGPVSVANIRGVAAPVLVSGNPADITRTEP